MLEISHAPTPAAAPPLRQAPVRLQQELYFARAGITLEHCETPDLDRRRLTCCSRS